MDGAALRVVPGADDADEPRVRRSVALLAGGAGAGDGEVVARATATASARRPVYCELEIDVGPAWRHRGAGRLLLDALGDAMAAAGCARRWTAAADVGDAERDRLLRSLGLVPAVTSRTGRLRLAGLDLRTPPPPPAVTVAAVELADCVPVYEDLYDESHWWSPYVPYARGVPWVSFLGELVPGTAFAALDLLGRPVSVVSVHRPAAGGPFLAPTAVRHGGRRPDAPAIVRALVTRSLAAAHRAGVAEVGWECDDTTPELWAVLGTLPVEVDGERRQYLSAEPSPAAS